MPKVRGLLRVRVEKGDQRPETVKAFRHFVNGDQPDRNVVFVAERGQIRPAHPHEREAALEAVEG